MEATFSLLPAGGLASSVITTVWVGIMVVTFFNLRFGTTLSGLVVPGYLIPLFIVHPVSGFVILGESVITYFIARVVADRGLVKIGLGEMFGRDRFFMLILISVLVRIAADGFLLPQLADQLALWGAPYELRSGLHSFGLIIIALCANQFWNGGFKIGGLSLSVYLLVTYAIVSYVLIPLTNFNITTLGYMYEDIASSILASPKAYIILITAAYVSSRMNLRYGWDFNGILIPSLLALQWYDPLKIITTFVEALVIFFGAQLVMQLPVIRNMNMEGARQLLLFFNVGFFYKVLLGYAIIFWFPEQKVTDYYGFGYVLGTLMALKMYQKGIAIRFVRTTVQTSLAAIVFASILGFALTYAGSQVNTNQYRSTEQLLLQTSEQSLSEFIAQSRRLTYQSQTAERGANMSGFEIAAFAELFKPLADLNANTSIERLNNIAHHAASMGYSASWIEQRYLALVESDASNGRGFYIVDTHAGSDLAIEVPHALDEPKAAGVAERVFTALDARYLAFAGSRSTRSEDGSDDVLLNAQTVFQQFHQALANNHAISLRSYTKSAARQLLGLRGDDLQAQIEQPSVWVKRSLPQHLSLGRLKEVIGDFDLRWHSPTLDNRQRDTAIRGYVEVYLNDSSLLNVYAYGVSGRQYTELEKELRIDGYLQSDLLADQKGFAAKHSNAYQSANQYQLLYFDQAILQPTLMLVDQLGNSAWDESYQSRLNHIAAQAAGIGYQVLLYRHLSTGGQYIIFKEHQDYQRHWGTYVIKLGEALNYFIEVPNPIGERNSFEFATELFESISARAILISATHPDANSDLSSQLTSVDNKDSLFNLVHQVLLQHYHGEQPFAVQVRGFTPTAEDDSGKIVVAQFEQRKPGARLHPGLLQLKQALIDSGAELLEPDPRRHHQRFVARHNAQSRFIKFVEDAQYAEIWLPLMLRQQFQRESQQGALVKKFAALHIQPRAVDIKHWLESQSFSVIAPERLNELKSRLQQFKDSQNISQLMALKQAFSPLQLVMDHNSHGYYLMVYNNKQQLQLAANLGPLNDEVGFIGSNSDDKQQSIATFVNNRQSLLIGGVKP